jgi:hypothetical protein
MTSMIQSKINTQINKQINKQINAQINTQTNAQTNAQSNAQINEPNEMTPLIEPIKVILRIDHENPGHTSFSRKKIRRKRHKSPKVSKTTANDNVVIESPLEIVRQVHFIINFISDPVIRSYIKSLKGSHQ